MHTPSARERSEHSPAGGLASFGLEAVAAGCTIVPTASDDAKRPLVKNWSRAHLQRRSTIHKWIERFPGANYGIVTGASGLVVVDCDDVQALASCEAHFGISAVLVRTGRDTGGWHAYYRWPDATPNLPGVNLRRLGITAEIKGDGAFVVGPGSTHPRTNLLYQFERGCWAALRSLAPFPVAVLHQLTYTGLVSPAHPSLNSIGTRNNALFDHLRAMATNGLVETEEQLIAEADFYNSCQNVVPESPGKVLATAESVWRYKKGGDLRGPANRSITIADWQIDALKTLGRGYADALALYAILRAVHRGHDASFAIGARAMAQAEVVPGWTDRKRYMNATLSLLECKLLMKISPSWAHRSDGPNGLTYSLRRPAKFRFGRSTG